MIKLIASDMDGTLIKDDKEIDKEIYDLLPRMKEKGILFLAASGRQYKSLFSLFCEHKKDVVFIAENGAFVIHNGEELYSSVMSRELTLFCIDEIKKLEHTEVILCSRYMSYTDNKEIHKSMTSEVFNYEMKLVDSLYEVEDDIIKVSIFDRSKEGPKAHSFKRLSGLIKNRASIAVSGISYVDIMNKGVSKGAAIETIQKKLGISTKETIAFGDNYNDVEMFARAYYSYAMENADDEVKKYAKFIAKSNNDSGVVREIKKLAGI